MEGKLMRGTRGRPRWLPGEKAFALRAHTGRHGGPGGGHPRVWPARGTLTAPVSCRFFVPGSSRHAAGRLRHPPAATAPAPLPAQVAPRQAHRRRRGTLPAASGGRGGGGGWRVRFCRLVRWINRAERAIKSK